MTPLVSYLVKAALMYLLCFVVYWVLFRKETFFFRNRIYLLISIILPAVIPLIRFSTGSPLAEIMPGHEIIRMISPATIQSETGTLPLSQQLSEHSFVPAPIPLSSILIGLYLAGVLFFLLRMILSYSGIIRMIIRSEHQRLSEMILVITAHQVSPFSLFRWLVIPEEKRNHPDLDKVICHERIHYRQWHSIDLLLSEILVVFQWFNPFVWMLKKNVVTNNEFFVDRRLISVYTDVRSYQYALLASSVGERRISMVNSFNQGLIKKRIEMMNKKDTRLINRIKDLLIVPFTIMLLVTFSAWSMKPAGTESGSGRVVIKTEKQDKKKTKKSSNSQVSIQVNGVDVDLKTDGDKFTDSSTERDGSKNTYSVLTEGKIYTININDPKGKERLIMVDGKIDDNDEWTKPRPVLIKTISMLDPDEAVKQYGDKAKYGALVITTKKE
jgi:beta-lactamase regulating signal transducer with metallopeptidase domain